MQTLEKLRELKKKRIIDWVDKCVKYMEDNERIEYDKATYPLNQDPEHELMLESLDEFRKRGFTVRH